MAVTETAPSRRRSLVACGSASLVSVGAARGSSSRRSTPTNLLPEHPHLSTLVFLAAGLAARRLRHRAVGVALAAGARGVRRPRAAAHARVALLRGAVRRQRPPVDHRRRRPAGQPGAPRPPGSGRVAFASVVLERLTGFVALPLLVVPRVPDPAVAARQSTTRGSRSLIAGVTLAAARASSSCSPAIPRLAGRFTRSRELDALHRRGARRRRPPPPPARADALRRARRGRRSTRLSTVAVVYCAVHALDARHPDRRRARVRARGRDGAGAPAVAERPRRPRGDARPPACTRSASRPVGAVARRAALVRDDARREPARRARVRGRPPARDRARRRRRDDHRPT